MSSRMITTRMPSIAETTDWGNWLQSSRKLTRDRTRTIAATSIRLSTMAYSMATISQRMTELVSIVGWTRSGSEFLIGAHDSANYDVLVDCTNDRRESRPRYR